MKYKVKIIIPYFGKLPDSIIPFLKSCSLNPEFEWIFFSDNDLDNLPLNVTNIKCELKDIKNKIEQTLGFTISLNAPYKLCDFRPAFGMIFSEYLMECDFWGWGDIDLVYGYRSKFITDSILEEYDKIYPCGHLSLIRNKKEINEAFMLDIEGTLNYKDVFTNPKSFIFDEYRGLNEKLLAVDKKVYGKIDFADMDIVYKRFRTADWKTIKKVFPEFLFKSYIPMNYKYQIFCYENGKAYREYFYGNEPIERNELVYIHYRYKIPCEIEKNLSSYYITQKGFLVKSETTTLEVIKKMNDYPGWFEEKKQYLRFYKERLIICLGKNKKLRNFIRVLKGKKKL